jgi:uncharacterized membrane protein
VADRLDTPLETRRRFIRRPQLDEDASGKVSESIARFLGTPRFIIYLTVFCLVWIIWNVWAPIEMRFDSAARGFTALTLMLSLQASYAAPLILLAQNRQEQRDKVINEQDRQANARAHADMEFLAREVASLRMSVGEVATRDYVRSELRSLLAELDDRTARAAKEAAREALEERGPGHDDAADRPAPPGT